MTSPGYTRAAFITNKIPLALRSLDTYHCGLASEAQWVVNMDRSTALYAAE